MWYSFYMQYQMLFILQAFDPTVIRIMFYIQLIDIRFDIKKGSAVIGIQARNENLIVNNSF